jgi:glycosyltransferase involved in cell wall biosynthesis
MNIFVIPSWYASPEDPISGIFFKEQTLLMAHHMPESNFAIAHWGPSHEDLLLRIGEPMSSFRKLCKALPESYENNLAPNVTEYFNPAFTWTWHWKQGNINQIIQAVQQSFLSFSEKFGQATLIHAHSGFPGGFIAKALSLTFGIPYIITEHMSPYPFSVHLKNENTISDRLKTAVMHAKANVAVSKHMSQRMEKFGIPNIQVIPNFVDDNFFVPGQNPAMKNTFFTLGRLVSQKGIDVLIKAIASISQDLGDWHFRIGGDGPDGGKYKLLARQLGVDSRIEWLGNLDRQQVKDELQNCKAFILPSRHEGLPLASLEALACGKPIIMSECGGSEELVTQETGLLVPVEDIKALGNAILHYISNHEEYSTQNIRLFFSERFGTSLIVDRYQKLYNSLGEFRSQTL